MKSFGNSWDYSYTRFDIVDIKFRFARYESDLCWNTVKFQIIMASIVAIFPTGFWWVKFHQVN